MENIEIEPYLIPSQVYDTKYVYPPGIPEQDRIEDRTFVGWWLVFSNNQDTDEEGLTAHDRLWFNIMPYVKAEELIFASASTSAPNAHRANEKNGVICVYTKDYRDTDDVKRTAEMIRVFSELFCPEILYYKTDEAIGANQYSCYGDRKICLYKQESNGSFYERGKNGDWDLIFGPSPPPQLE